MGTIIYIKGIGRHIEERLVRGLGNKRSRIWVSRGILVRAKKEVWR